MGHMNFDNLVKISTKQEIRDIQKIIKPSRTICKQCQHEKQSRVNFKTKEHATSKTLELVHTYLCGPSRTKIFQGEGHFMLLIDDYTRMNWVSFLKNKSKELDKFKAFKSIVDNDTEMNIKCLSSENGGQFTPNEFVEFCEAHRIKIQDATTRTS